MYHEANELVQKLSSELSEISDELENNKVSLGADLHGIESHR
jgi:hypothetical protein